jgi:hypothetical protein
MKNEETPRIWFKPKNTNQIQLGGRTVRLTVNTDTLASYMAGRLPPIIAPNTFLEYEIYFRLNPDVSNLGAHVFTEDEKGILPYAAGFRSQRAPVICINFPVIWNSLFNDKKDDSFLLERAYRVLAHEFEHVALFAQTELQTPILDGTEKSIALGKLAPFATRLAGFVFSSGITRYLRKTEGNTKEKLSRREFLRISAIVSAGSIFPPTWLLADIMNPIARYIHDSRLDPIHRKAYEAENNWQQLEGAIQISND